MRVANENCGQAFSKMLMKELIFIKALSSVIFFGSKPLHGDFNYNSLYSFAPEHLFLRTLLGESF